MSTIIKEIELVPSATNPESILRIEVFYKLGGYHNGIGKKVRRGYYLFATPLEKKQRIHPDGTAYTVLSQINSKRTNYLLKEVARHSAKAEAEAVRCAEEDIDFITECACNQYGLVIKHPYIRKAETYDKLKSSLSEADLAHIEAKISEYEEELREEYNKNHETHPAAVCWWENLITTDDLIKYYLS